MFEASVLKSASMEAQQIVQEGEKEARQIVEQARHSSVDTQLDAYRRAAKRAAALEAAVAERVQALANVQAVTLLAPV